MLKLFKGPAGLSNKTHEPYKEHGNGEKRSEENVD